MQDVFATPKRFPGIEKKVNLFFVIAILALIGTVLLVSYKQGAFVQRTSIYFYADDAFGISKGMAVKLHGLPIGSVKTMNFSDRGVIVELSLITNYSVHIPKGSRARLLREGYIGAASIQLLPSSPPGRRTSSISEGDVVEFVHNRGVAELIDDLKNQVTPILVQMQKVLVDINSPESDFRKSATAARVLIGQLVETNEDLRKVLRTADRTMTNLEPEARVALSAIARISVQTDKQLPAMSSKLDAVLESVDGAAHEVRDQIRNNGVLLTETLNQTPSLVRQSETFVRNGTDLVREGRELVGAARNIWPLSSAVESQSMRTLSIDSYEAGVPTGPDPQ